MKLPFSRFKSVSPAALHDEFIHLLEQLSEAEVDWIVLRSHDDIRDSLSISDDIDLLVRRSDLVKIASYAKSAGWDTRLDSCWNNQYLYGAFPHFHIVSRKSRLHIDIVSNLSYRSPNKGEWVKVHESIQSSMWENRVTVDEPWKYMPSAVDELLHLVCHCMLDKREFAPKYQRRIQSLENYLHHSRLKELLELVFFSYTDILTQRLIGMDFVRLPQEYIEFSQY